MADTQAEPDAGPEGFFRLPPEIRDMIYEMVYGEQRTVKVLPRNEFNERETDRKRQMRKQFVPNAFPESFLSPMLVLGNKQFFEEAARVWLRTKQFFFTSCMYFSTYRMNTTEQYLLRSITSMKFDGMVWRPCIHDFTNLRAFDIQLSERYFDRDSSFKTPWEDDYTDAEIAANRHLEVFLQLKGVQSLRVNWDTSFQSRSVEEVVRMKAFQHQVEALIRDVVCQPRERPRVASAPATLEEALATGLGEARHSQAVTGEPAPEVIALTNYEVPKTEDQLVRICLSKPEAMMKWISKAQTAMTELETMRQHSQP